MPLSTCFLLSHRLDASRHVLANLLVISDDIWHLNFTDCFGDKGFALGLNNGLQTLSKSIFPFPLLLGTLYTRARFTKTSN